MDLGLEQMAVIGIVLFAVIAALHGINTVRGIRRISARRVGEGRMRRLVSSEEVAREMARSLLRELASKHEEAAARSREAGRVDPGLSASLDEIQVYFRERVESRLRPVFNQTVDEVILGKTV